MTKLKLMSLFVAVAVGFVVSAYGVAYLVASSRDEALVAAGAQAATQTDTPAAGTQIAFWSNRVAGRPRAYLELTLLGQAFARKARETSDAGYYLRAEVALRRALRANPKHVPAAVALSSVLLATHDFQGALVTARQVVDHPHGVQALATVGDASLALGRYRRAQAAYARLLDWSPTAAAYSRLAVLADLRGKPDEALRLLDRAERLALESGDYGESLAWYAFQQGEVAFRAGRIELAESRYRSALGTFPGYPLALGGLGKTKAAKGETSAAIAVYRRLTEAAPQPDHVAALGDLYSRVGESRAAREQHGAVGVLARIARATGRLYDRQVAISYADRGVSLGAARRLALGELRVRKDIHGFDAAAWTLARSGRCAEALPLAQRALRLGTKDALLFFHRGYAEGCAGNAAARRAWYARALALNPHFSIRWAPVARAALRNG
ncbi:MAG TPA: tetratricopeptide repeat protein [Gaiellaceae bacterium]|nr:tetratricopeptide repeat protein [Gaiellaceae bacterium]